MRIAISIGQGSELLTLPCGFYSRRRSAPDRAEYRQAAPGQPNHPTAADFLSETFGQRKRLQLCYLTGRKIKCYAKRSSY